ncbi:hypothetical protein MPER_01016, partial [Moniliophthora perniciosa FA553]
MAKLQVQASSTPSSSSASTPVANTPGPSTPQRKATPPPPPKLKPAIISPPKKPEPIVTPAPVPTRKKAPPKFEPQTWEHETITFVFKATLEKTVAEKSGYDIVWLKPLADEISSEGGSLRLTEDSIDRLLIARLEVDPQNMSDDLEFLPVLASLPPQQTIFEYLVGCWKRINSSRSALLKKG